MAIYIIHKANPYFKNGTVVELFEHGFQACILRDDGTIRNHEPLILPEESVMPYCIKMLNRGFDDPKLRRKSGKDITDPGYEKSKYGVMY